MDQAAEPTWATEPELKLQPAAAGKVTPQAAEDTGATNSGGDRARQDLGTSRNPTLQRYIPQSLSQEANT